MNYQPRIIDHLLADYLEGLSAIALVGAKGVGKTSTARRLAATTLRLDVSEAARTVASTTEGLAALKERPVLVDEWSRLPISWDVVRRIVDEDPSPGHFILTGSASQKGLSIHSGAGRIVTLMMRPQSIRERALCELSLSLGDVLMGAVAKGFREECELTASDYLHEIVSSGFPGIRSLADRHAKVQLDGYIDNIVHKEFEELGLKVRKPQVLRGWMRAYAAATGTITSYKKILIASTPGEDQKPSSSTTLTYRDTLDALFITDRVDPWLPTSNWFSALGKTPKHYLVDSGLAARLLGLSYNSLMADTAKMLGRQRESSASGRLFENLVASSLKTYCQFNDVALSHFRAPDGSREVDFVIEGDDVILGVEVKFASIIDEADTANLLWLREKIGADKRYHMMIIYAGTEAYWRHDGVLVTPLGLLAE